MKQKVMDAMQSFSRALMGPVLFLPIAGMLQAISSVMSNTALVTEGGVVWTLGKFINGGVGAVIGNLGILFCVGIAMSLAKKRKADAAFLALVSYLVWLAANSRWLDVAGLTIAGDTASALYRKASARVSAAMRAKNVSSLHCPLAPRLMNPNPRVRPRRAA